MTTKIRRTVKLKLNIPRELVEPTVKAYTQAFNLVCKEGWQSKDFNSISLHRKTYKTVRGFLPAQLAISSRMKAAEALKPALQKLKKKQKVSCPQTKSCSVRLDARSYGINLSKKELSILTVEGRIKIPFVVPAYFQQYVDWKYTSADLFLRKTGIFLNVVFEIHVLPPATTENVVGIDIGIKKLAVTSDNKFFSGKQVKKFSNRFSKIRAALQSRGTTSAKRHLCLISKKENRFRADINHQVSKAIINFIPAGSTVVLEDLKAIRETTRLRKKQRKEIHKWSFFQLQQFISYKAEAKGIKIEYVDSRYTSQKCSCCGYISRSNRKFQSVFKCKQCGFSLNADLNASRNIRQKFLDATRYPERAAVNQPIVASLSA